MPTKPYKVPLWSVLYPQLADKEELIRIYSRCKRQKKAAAEIGCSETTFRKALAYHGIKTPFVVHKDKGE